MDDFRKRVYFSAGMIFTSFVLFGILFYGLGAYISSTAKAVVAIRERKETRVELLESLSTLKRETAEAEDLKKKIDALLPPQDALLSFPQFLESVSRARGVSANTSFSGSPILPSKKEPGTAPFTLSVTGSASDIAEFLKDVEFKTSQFWVTVDNLTFFPDGQGFRAEANGKVFFK